MGYSLCVVAIFVNFQNALIFRILAVFFEPFFEMCCRNVFNRFFAVFCIKQLECVCGDVVGMFVLILLFSILHGL